MSAAARHGCLAFYFLRLRALVFSHRGRVGRLTKYPKISTILNKVEPYLTTKAVIRLNAGFDLQHQDAMALASQFLKSKGLLK